MRGAWRQIRTLIPTGEFFDAIIDDDYDEHIHIMCLLVYEGNIAFE